MYIGIDQYGNKEILPDKKYKTLKEIYYCGSIRKMYRDINGQPKHIGYVLGQGKDNISLWVEIFKITPIYKEVK